MGNTPQKIRRRKGASLAGGGNGLLESARRARRLWLADKVTPEQQDPPQSVAAGLCGSREIRIALGPVNDSAIGKGPAAAGAAA
jgi:hypothetical protein